MYVFKASVVIFMMAFLNEAVVSTPVTTKPPTQLCKICKEMVAEARETLASNETMEEMKEVFEGTCKILVPIKSLANLCAKYVDELVPELVETLYEEMDPTRVCVTSGLCYSATLHDMMTSVKTVQARFVSKITEMLMKTDPEAFVTLAENVEISDERIQNLLKGMCYLLAERKKSAECADSVGAYYGVVKSFLATQYKNGGDCDMCKLVVEAAESEIFKPEIETALQSEVIKLCAHTGSYEAECNAFINQYFPDLWKLVVQAVKDQSLCKDLGFCSTQTIEIEKPKVKSDECTICKGVVGEAKMELLSDEVVSEVQALVTSLCEYCPTKDECTKYLDKNFVKLYKSVISKLDPTIICKSLGVCTVSGLPSSDPRVITFAQLEKNAVELRRVSLDKQDLDFSGGEVECTVCKYVVHFIQGEVVKNKSIQYIKKELKDICKRLPVVGEECEAFVDVYSAQLAQLLAHEIDPNNVCYKLTNICSAKQEILPVKPLKVTKCSVCQMAVDYIDHLLQDDKVDVDLSALVQEVCQMMPKSTSKQCIDVVSTYGPSIIHYIGEAANSREVCQHISLCSMRKPLLGEKKCTYGPAYWCQNIGNAKECNALEHCQKRVWGKQM